jgi:hypothetical protein
MNNNVTRRTMTPFVDVDVLEALCSVVKLLDPKTQNWQKIPAADQTGGRRRVVTVPTEQPKNQIHQKIIAHSNKKETQLQK